MRTPGSTQSPTPWKDEGRRVDISPHLDLQPATATRFEPDTKCRAINVNLRTIDLDPLKLVFCVGSALHDQFTRLDRIHIDEGECHAVGIERLDQRPNLLRKSGTPATRVEIADPAM